ncbi:MAG: hypothetical protein HY617_03065 [Candidatus Sungbacteria bacterium]|nr:hypothetical protein [Candidatus Sungbacteria bacterium]
MGDVDKLQALLAAERMDQNRIYVIARMIGMLRWYGVKIWTRDEDWQRIVAALDAARADSDERVLNFLPRGYEIARWHMIIAAVRPHQYHTVEITEDDLIAMSDAFLRLKAERNFRQQASLLQTCAYIGAEPILPDYSLDELCRLGKALQNLQADVI